MSDELFKKQILINNISYHIKKYNIELDRNYTLEDDISTLENVYDTLIEKEKQKLCEKLKTELSKIIERAGERANERTDGRTDGRTNKQTKERTN